jgi:hypothetical protein
MILSPNEKIGNICVVNEKNLFLKPIKEFEKKV